VRPDDRGVIGIEDPADRGVDADLLDPADRGDLGFDRRRDLDGSLAGDRGFEVAGLE